MAKDPQIPLPETPISTAQGWRIWWRFFQKLSSSVNYIVNTGTDSTSAQTGEFEAQIAELLNRVKALEARTQLLPDQPASKADVRQCADEFQRSMETLAALAEPQNPGVFNNLTVTLNGGLMFQGQTSDAKAATGTLTNSPTAGNPIFWLRGMINGVSVASPWWAA